MRENSLIQWWQRFTRRRKASWTSALVCIALGTSAISATDEAQEPNHQALSSPLLESVKILACAQSADDASVALNSLETNYLDRWQLPNEWQGTSRSPQLFAGSIDIAIAALLESAQEHPNLQPRIDHLLMSWNYCNLIGRNSFYNIGIESPNAHEGVPRSPASKETPLQWSGFKLLGIAAPWQTTQGIDASIDGRYVPPLLETTRQTPLFRVNRFWQLHTKQCFPHPSTGQQFYRKQAFGPTRLDTQRLFEADGTSYPFSWSNECDVPGNPASDLSHPENPQADSSLLSDLPIDAEQQIAEQQEPIPTLAADLVAIQNETDALFPDHAYDAIDQTAKSGALVAQDENLEPQKRVTGNSTAQETASQEPETVIEVPRRTERGEQKELNVLSRKRLSKFRKMLVQASRRVAENNLERDRALRSFESADPIDTGDTHKINSSHKETTYGDYLENAKNNQALLTREKNKRFSRTTATRVQVSRRFVKTITPPGSEEKHKAPIPALANRESLRRLTNVKVLRVQKSRLYPNLIASNEDLSEKTAHKAVAGYTQQSDEVRTKSVAERIADSAENENLFQREKLKRLNGLKSRRVRWSRKIAGQSTKNETTLDLQTASARSALYQRERNKRLHLVKRRRVQDSRLYRDDSIRLAVSSNSGRADSKLRSLSSGSQTASPTVSLSLPLPGKTKRTNPGAVKLAPPIVQLSLPLPKKRTRFLASRKVLNPARAGRRQMPYMTRASIWRVLLSRAYGSRSPSRTWRNAYAYLLPVAASPSARMAKGRHARRLWGVTGLDGSIAKLDSTRAASAASREKRVKKSPQNGPSALSFIATTGDDLNPAIAAVLPDPDNTSSSMGMGGTQPGAAVSPIANAPPYPKATSPDTTNHGFSGSLSLNNTQLEFTDPDHYSATAMVAYKPIKDSFFFLRTGITVNNSDDPLSYTWGIGYDDWHPGSWGFELNNWNPLKPGDGLDLENVVASLTYKFAWEKLKENKLGSSLALNKSANSEFSLTWLVSWAPIENWFVRSLLTQPLEGGEMSWAYGFGYNNWRNKTISLEYNNWGYNDAFDTNFRQNAIVTLGYKWQW